MKLQKNPFQVVEKTIWEIQELTQTEVNPAEHHAIECKVVGMQMVNTANVKNAVTGQTEPMIAIMAQVLIPIDPRKLSSLITPDGMSTSFTKASPIAPTLRVVLNEEYMCPSYIPEKSDDSKEEENPQPDFSLDDFLKEKGITK